MGFYSTGWNKESVFVFSKLLTKCPKPFLELSFSCPLICDCLLVIFSVLKYTGIYFWTVYYIPLICGHYCANSQYLVNLNFIVTVWGKVCIYFIKFAESPLLVCNWNKSFIGGEGVAFLKICCLSFQSTQKNLMGSISVNHIPCFYCFFLWILLM